jgi:hypothetical protein
MDRPAQENTSGPDEVKSAMVYGTFPRTIRHRMLQNAKLAKLQLLLPRADDCPTTRQLAHCMDIRTDRHLLWVRSDHVAFFVFDSPADSS